MTVEKLKRVMWRLDALNKKVVSRSDLERAIIMEIGHTPETYRNARRALSKLGWVQFKKHKVWVTGRHETIDHC